MAKMFKREDFNIVTESDNIEPSPSRFSRKDESSSSSGGKLLKVVAVSFGLLCVLQVSLNVSLRLGFFTQSMSECEAQVALLHESNNNLTKVNYNLLNRTHQLENSHENLMREAYNSLVKEKGWVHLGSSLYYMSTMEKSWQESRKDCQERGADLMIIDNQAEQYLALLHHNRMWIGLTDAEHEGVWKWVDGRRLQDNSKWCPNEPNDDKGEDCGEIVVEKCWNDLRCDRQNYWICEKKIA